MQERAELVRLLESFFQRLFSSTETEALSALADMELSMSQIRVAMLLGCVDEPVPINEIAAQVGLSVAAAGRAVERLVELHLLERREDRHDRRVRLVSLSEQGRTFVESHFTARRQALLAFIDRLPEGHVRSFAAALEPILAGDYLRPPSTCRQGNT